MNAQVLDISRSYHQSARLEELASWPCFWKIIADSIDALKTNNTMKLQTLSIHFDMPWDDLQPFLSNQISMLTTLNLRGMRPRVFPLQAVLRCCPNLLHLHVYSPAGSSVVQEIPSGQESAGRDVLMPLRSLSLESMCVHEGVLESILERTPDLEELYLIKGKLQGIAGTPQNTEQRWVSLSNMDIFRRIAALCPNIASLHLSPDINLQLMTAPASQFLWSLFPKLRKWSIYGMENPNTIFAALATVREPLITSLEITHGKLDYLSSYLFHEFLCKAPHLLELRTCMFVPISCLDLEGNLTSQGVYRHRGDPEMFNYPQGYVRREDHPKTIWACRDLRVLELNFDEYYNTGDYTDECRLVYGYISKVCPNLEELLFRRVHLNPKLDGGMILLSRLHKLRRLVYIAYNSAHNLEDKDLEWITRDMTAELKQSLLKKIPGLQWRENHVLHQLTPFGSSSWAKKGENKKKPGNNKYMVDGVNMRNIGRYYDIVDVIRERASREWICWPNMENWECVIDQMEGWQQGFTDFGTLKPTIQKFREGVTFRKVARYEG
ncbi:hypothetical protein BG004_000255 [Podila humilis]|nr:hypothetical protein BG004_000255 [Podila humilis]